MDDTASVLNQADAARAAALSVPAPPCAPSNEASVAQQLLSAGYEVHENDGVWWQRRGRGFCKPVDPMRTIPRGSARPRWSKSPLGHSYVVPTPAQANHTWEVMWLEGERLRGFEIGYLKPRKRSATRKALRELEVRRIEAIDPVLPAMNELNIATAKRTQHGKPPHYYVDHRAEWETFMRREFSICGREWWGAFFENRLISYYYGILIGGTMHIAAAKSDTAYLKMNPNDAVAFTFFSYCAGLPNCHAVLYGDWSPETPSLNEFKEQFGFERRSLPVYRAEGALFRLASFGSRVIKGLRSRGSAK